MRHLAPPSRRSSPACLPIAALAALLLAPAPALAASYWVGNGGNPPCTHATLQQAMDAAVGAAGDDVIYLVGAGPFNGPFTEVGGGFEIVGNVESCGATLSVGRSTVNAPSGERPLTLLVLGVETVRLRHLVVTTGQTSHAGDGGAVHFTGGSAASRLELVDTRVVDSVALGIGGGILVSGGRLTVVAGSQVSGNTANAGGGIAAAAGAIVELDGAGVVGNTSFFDGGGIHAQGGASVIVGSSTEQPTVVANNVAARYGGGLYLLDEAEHRISSAAGAPPAVVSGNQAQRGGGVFVDGSFVRLDYASIDHNQASIEGGALYLAADGTLVANSFDQPEPTRGGYPRIESNAAPQAAVMHVDDGAVVLASGRIRDHHAGAGSDGLVRLLSGILFLHGVALEGNQAPALFSIENATMLQLEHVSLAGNTVGGFVRWRGSSSEVILDLERARRDRAVVRLLPVAVDAAADRLRDQPLRLTLRRRAPRHRPHLGDDRRPAVRRSARGAAPAPHLAGDRQLPAERTPGRRRRDPFVRRPVPPWPRGTDGGRRRRRSHGALRRRLRERRCGRVERQRSVSGGARCGLGSDGAAGYTPGMSQRPIDPATFPSELRELATKVRDGIRLDEADALQCFTTPHLLHLGKLADSVRRRLHGDVAYFNVNRHINPTNVCVYTYNCKFCSFAALRGRGARLADDARGGLRARGAAGRQRGHRVPHRRRPAPRPRPRLVRGDAARAQGALPAGAPEGLHRHRDRLVRQAREAVDRGGAAAPAWRRGWARCPAAAPRSSTPRCAQIICDGKLDADEWIEVHRIAHGMGLKTNCTMLYGHVERLEHRVDHLLRLRALQDETGGFNCLHPARLPPREQLPGAQVPHRRAARTCAPSPPRGWCSTTSRTSRPTGSW